MCGLWAAPPGGLLILMIPLYGRAGPAPRKPGPDRTQAPALPIVDPPRQTNLSGVRSEMRRMSLVGGLCCCAAEFVRRAGFRGLKIERICQRQPSGRSY